MLNKKEKQIIQYLIKDKDKFVTSKELAAQLGCSDRTIRTYYKTLVEKLDFYSGIDLISKQGYGYKLDIVDDDTYADFLEENHINAHHNNYQNITDISDRYNYLLNKLLFEQNEIYFDDLADKLFVSRSTLSSDFKKIRQIISEEDYTLVEDTTDLDGYISLYDTVIVEGKDLYDGKIIGWAP